jgi:hypothetical protein
MHSSVVSRVFTAQVFELCWVRTRAAQEPGSRRTAGCGRRAAAEHRRPPSRKTGQPARHYAHTGPHIPTSSSSPTQAPSFQWPSLVIFQGVQQPRQDAGRARALPASSGRKAHTHTPRQALPSQQPSGRKVGQQSKQARTRARPAHRARPLLNRWLPTHSFPQRVAARTYSTSPAQAHALVGCTASHRPRHTNERPRAQAVRTIPAEAGSARQRIGVSFPCDKRRGTRPPQSNTGSVTTPTGQAR